MILKSLTLTSFKNHQNAQFSFGDRINCLLGRNGVGKTNLLDAIYYLSFSKSAFSIQDRNAIMHEHSFFAIHGKYNDLTVAIQAASGKSKTIKVNGREPDKLSDLIGLVPLVLVLPDDTQMIREGSEERRKFFDGAVSQFEKPYLQDLLHYGKLLKQRNSLLKNAEDRGMNLSLLDTYDQQLIPLAKKISQRRAELAEVFVPFLEKNYQDMHQGNEQPALEFSTEVDEGFAEKFKASLQRDRIMRRTMMGSHRDDFNFLLNGVPIKKYGSQGQQKTFILSIKLALYDFLKEKTGKTPLLLLDDIFDKLDDNRIQLLISLLADEVRFGQIFITDARSERSRALLSDLGNVEIFEI
ncbi:MAG: DNA replication/repair protein RecF [Bacteroidota bacterium]